jgi:hypothetical protein
MQACRDRRQIRSMLHGELHGSLTINPVKTSSRNWSTKWAAAAQAFSSSCFF